MARLFKIVTLAASPSTGRLLGRRELAEACECTVRTVQRDLSLLAEAGIPIDYDARHRVYRLPEQGWSFPTASLTAADALALALLSSLVTTPGLPQGDALQKTLGKLTVSLPPGLFSLMQEAAQVVTWGTPLRDYSAAPLGELQEAARRHQSVEIDYESRSRSERFWRRVDPYVVEARAGQFWEFHGWCHRNKAIRTFALDQVFGMREIGAAFAVHEPEWAAFSAARGVIGGIRGEESVPVEVVFVPPVAVYARTRQWPAGLVLTPAADGAVRLSGTAAGVSGLVPELLRWRRYCHVLGGPALRTAMTEEVHALAALYFEQPPVSGFAADQASDVL